MGKVYTRVRCTTGGWLSNGAVTREAAIEDARRHYRHQLEIAETFLDTPDSLLEVAVVRGSVSEKVVRELPPVNTGDAA